MYSRWRAVLWLTGLHFIAFSSSIVGADKLCTHPTRDTGTKNEQIKNAVNTTRTPRKVQVCCLGYDPKGSSDHFAEVESEENCEPSCHPTCPANSRCVPPPTCECVNDAEFFQKQLAVRTCVCNSGFIHKAPDQCVPICPDFCTNGTCINDKCVCDSGHQTNASGLCVPQCIPGCQQDEECTAPNVCSGKLICFDEKYQRNSSGHCVPKCTDCFNDKCVCENAEKCVPAAGYAYNGNAGKCEALCDSCDNGQCIAPGTCACYPNFQMVNGVCEPCPSTGCLGLGDFPTHANWFVSELYMGGLLSVAILIICAAKCRSGRRKRREKHAERKRFNFESRDRFRIRVEQHRRGNKLRPPCPLPRPKEMENSHADGEYVEVVEVCGETTQKQHEVPVSTPEPQYEEIQQSNVTGEPPSFELPYDPLALSQRRSPEQCNPECPIPPEVPPRPTAKQNELHVEDYLEPKSCNILVESN